MIGSSVPQPRQKRAWNQATNDAAAASSSNSSGGNGGAGGGGNKNTNGSMGGSLKGSEGEGSLRPGGRSPREESNSSWSSAAAMGVVGDSSDGGVGSRVLGTFAGAKKHDLIYE